MNAATPPDPRQWQEAARWLERANEDIRAAETLVAADPPVLGSAAFHCQQAVEKMAKAALIAARIAPPRVHDIVKLAGLVKRAYPDIGAAIDPLAATTSWYIAARYPDTSIDSEPSVSEIRDTLGRIHALLAQIRALGVGVAKR